MKVLINRKLRKEGLIKKKMAFILEVRAELTSNERALIDQCDAGDAILHEWNPSWAPNIDMTMSVNSMVSGTSIDCASFVDLIETEEDVKQACQTLVVLLDKAKSFGQEEVFDF